MRFCSGLLALVTVAAPPVTTQDDLSNVARRFSAVLDAMKSQKDTLQKSTQKEDRARAVLLKQALDQAKTSGLQKRLERVAALELRSLRDPEKVRTAVKAVQEAQSQLQELLILLVPDPPDAPPKPDKRFRSRQVVPRLRALSRAQREVNEATTAVAKAVRARPEKKLTPEEERKLGELAARQEKTLWDVSLAHALLAVDGAVAVPELLRQIQRDMRHVCERLRRGNVDPITLGIQKDADDSLSEIAAALAPRRLGKPPARLLSEAFPTILPDLCALDEILFRAETTLKSGQGRP